MILFGYVVSFDILASFTRAWKLQLALNPISEFVIASDKLWSLPSLGVFESRVNAKPLYVGNEFNCSRARNLCIDEAIRRGAEWLVLLDADSVFVRPITVTPASGLGNVKVRWQSNGETIAQSLAHFNRSVLSSPPFTTQEGLDAHNRLLNSIGLTAAWPVVHRKLFTKYRFDEGYVGYGAEDCAYSEEIKKRTGIIHSDCDATAIHLWHPKRNQSRSLINWGRYCSIYRRHAS